MSRYAFFGSLLLLVGCQPAELNRYSTADIRSVADCVFAQVSARYTWRKEENLTEGRIQIHLEGDDIETITIEKYMAGTRAQARFPTKATGAAGDYLAGVFESCGARDAI